MVHLISSDVCISCLKLVLVQTNGFVSADWGAFSHFDGQYGTLGGMLETKNRGMWHLCFVEFGFSQIPMVQLIDPDCYFNLARISKRTSYSFHRHWIEFGLAGINLGHPLVYIAPRIPGGIRTVLWVLISLCYIGYKISVRTILLWLVTSYYKILLVHCFTLGYGRQYERQMWNWIFRILWLVTSY